MTGARGSSPGIICALCGGRLAEGRADMPLPMEGGILLVKGVPADICGDCGEPYLVGNTVDRIKEIVKSFENLATEVSIVSYRAA